MYIEDYSDIQFDYKEDWVLKNWCFQIVVLEKTLESPLDCRSNQSILKEINPEYSLKWLMLKLKLKLQDLGHLIWRVDSLEKTLIIGKTKGERGGRGGNFRQHHQLSGHESEQIPEDSGGQKSLVCCSPWGPRVGRDLVTAQQQPCIYSRNAICNLNFATKKVLGPHGFIGKCNQTFGEDIFLHRLFQKIRFYEWSEVAQLCPTLCDPMDCSLRGSFLHEIFQARMLEWVAISFSKILWGHLIKLTLWNQNQTKYHKKKKSWTNIPHKNVKIF